MDRSEFNYSCVTLVEFVCMCISVKTSHKHYIHSRHIQGHRQDYALKLIHEFMAENERAQELR